MSERFRITLEAARVNAGMLQKEVCERLGISLTTLVNWEKGKTMPTADRAMELADLYGLEIGDIIFCKNT